MSKVSNFYLVKEGSKLAIRQMVVENGYRRQIRYSRKKYSHITQNREALQKFCDQLNYGVDLENQRRTEYQTAFIPAELMEAFAAQLQNEIPNRKDFRYIHNTVLKKYFLGFFIGQLGILDPKEWIKKQALWGQALTGHSRHSIFTGRKSAKTVKTIIQTANRFMAFLHAQRPFDYPPIKFKPFSVSYLKSLKAEATGEKIGHYISEADWKAIDRKLPRDIGPFIRLMYHYGLRRAEALGFDSTDAIRKAYLDVRKQLRAYNGKAEYKILKDKEQRRTPHWFCKPARAHAWVLEGIEAKMHPDTLSVRFDEFMEALGLSYKTHDLRRTFITNALRMQHPRDVQLAVGHSSLETTMAYAQDDRDLGDEIWRPSA